MQTNQTNISIEQRQPTDKGLLPHEAADFLGLTEENLMKNRTYRKFLKIFILRSVYLYPKSIMSNNLAPMRTRLILLLSVLLSASPALLTLAETTKVTPGSTPTASPLLAQREDCFDKYDRKFTPSSTTRTVDLKQFGIQVKIPNNFRTMLRNDGEVWIVNPVDYDLIACSVRGGIGGRGLYHPYIRRRPNPSGLPVHQWVSQRERLKKIQRGKFYRSSVQPYQVSGLDGVLVESGSRLVQPSYFMAVPGMRDVVEIGVGCDCDVRNKELVEFLKNVSLR